VWKSKETVLLWACENVPVTAKLAMRMPFRHAEEKTYAVVASTKGFALLLPASMYLSPDSKNPGGVGQRPTLGAACDPTRLRGVV
jgi:hypothetical protein